jgi:hypothetical protein
MVPPGQKTNITLTVHVDDAVARDISLGREVAFGTGSTGNPPTIGGLLDDMLVLRIERGRDHYLPATATVLPTAFGCSLAQLARRPEPMRALALTAAATVAMNSAAGIVLGGVPAATNAAAQVGGEGGTLASRSP